MNITWAVLVTLITPGADDVDYSRDVRPILVSRCYRCHGSSTAESGLRLDSVAAMTAGGDRGPAVVAGDLNRSLLVEAIQGSDELKMPPEGEPLTEEQVSRILQWIDEGATPPEVDGPRAHWSFRTPVRPALGPVGAKRPLGNPIDAFLSRRHLEMGLTPTGPAPPAILLRRIYLDLIGLPPTEIELAHFLADDAPDAYERVVDSLIASPRYGERWGRHWMDVWRYSDWSGYKKEVRNSQPHIWRWRDWIVDSLNRDRAYDTMVAHMLAADELAPEDSDALRATGFLARNWYKFNRNVWLDNTVEHTAKAFLGLTIGCARCHDHMYDPVTQEDYYRFRAIFEPYQVRTDPLPGTLDTTRDGLVRAFDERLDAETYLFTRGDERHPDKTRLLSPGIPALFDVPLDIQTVSLPVAAWYPAVREPLRADRRSAVSRELSSAGKAMATARKKLTDVKRAAASDDRARPPESPVPRLTDDFQKPRDDVWTADSGDWQYAGGRLIQSGVRANQDEMRLLCDVPDDFEAHLVFRITGGEKWHSVGISFDADPQRCHSVYLSAYAGGPKLQISHRVAGQTEYPDNGRKPLPIVLNRDLRLTVQVQGSLVNVLVDDEFQLAYPLESGRYAGSLSFWTFDATAEFSEFCLAAIPEGMRLRQPGSVDSAETLAAAQYRLDLAEARHRSAASALVSFDARAAADDARFGEPPAPDDGRKALVREAVLAEVHATIDQKRVLLLEAEHELEQFLLKRRGQPKTDALDKQQKELRARRDEIAEQLTKARQAKTELPPTYQPLGDVYPRSSSGRRSALARWITAADNPLLGRVAVNHVWMRHFGQPLVPTVDDFGQNGKPPIDAELLDWLAVEFVESGWSLKHLSRLIVTSDAYRRHSASPVNGDQARSDPENRYLWRMHSRRMEGEIVRDSVLSVGRDLDMAMGGPELDQTQGQTTHRRSLYYRHAYEKQMTFLKLFDAASVEECYRRSESVVPQQALALANSPLVIEQARRIASILNAQRVDADDSDESFVGRAFRKVLLRDPDRNELADCCAFLASQAQLLAGKHGPLTPFDAGASPPTPPAGDPALRARENLVHVLLNHNEFITIR